MANCDNLFKEFDGKVQITKSKRDSLMNSKNNLRVRIKNYFEKEHPDYKPKFYIQGSYKMKTIIQTKDNTCDLDDGVYFSTNPDNVTGTTLQKWVKDAVDGVTDASPSHRKKCITVDYKAGYNIDLPVFWFDKDKHNHPKLAVKNEEFKTDDPKEFVEKFNSKKDSEGQMLRIVRYLKAWCDNKRQEMPSGLAMTILAMDNWQRNSRDDVSLKFTLIEIERVLKVEFKCKMQTTPFDDIFANYSDAKRENFLNNLSSFITDAKAAVDNEKNQLKASKLWRKHLGERFPEGKDEDEKSASAASLNSTIGSAKPYFCE